MRRGHHCIRSTTTTCNLNVLGKPFADYVLLGQNTRIENITGTIAVAAQSICLFLCLNVRRRRSEIPETRRLTQEITEWSHIDVHMFGVNVAERAHSVPVCRIEVVNSFRWIRTAARQCRIHTLVTSLQSLNNSIPVYSFIVHVLGLCVCVRASCWSFDRSFRSNHFPLLLYWIYIFCRKFTYSVDKPK